MKVNDCQGDLTDASAKMKSLVSGGGQCFIFSRIITQVTPKIIHLYYVKKTFLNQSIQKKKKKKTEALAVASERVGG